MGHSCAKRITACVLISTAFLVSVVFAADKRTVVDSAGRRIEVPAKIERVFAAGGPASVVVYTLAPESEHTFPLPTRDCLHSGD